MKKLLILTSLVFGSIMLNGCYTKVMWDTDRPSESSKYSNANEVSHEYYNREYYGGYSNFYSSYWWYSLPTANGKDGKGKAGGRKDAADSFRDGNSGRGLNVRIDTAPATHSSSSGSASSASSSKTQSSTETRTTNSAADKKSERSDDGGRKTNGGNK